MRTLRVGTRKSALALWQAQTVVGLLRQAWPGVLTEIVPLSSSGDLSDAPLFDVGGTGVFTATLERQLLDGGVDIAVHSFKDLPVAETSGLTIAAVPARGPVEDALVSRGRLTLSQLPTGAAVGTCSLRRAAQLLRRRPDLRVVPTRGNVPTRVEQVMQGTFDAVVLAHAGLQRLRLESAVAEVFTTTDMLPAPAQGALAVQCRKGDETLIAQLRQLDHDATRREVTAERTVLGALRGGCSIPVGAVARATGADVDLTAAVFAVDGRQVVEARRQGPDPRFIGERVAEDLCAAGAGPLLAAAVRTYAEEMRS